MFPIHGIECFFSVKEEPIKRHMLEMSKVLGKLGLDHGRASSASITASV